MKMKLIFLMFLAIQHLVLAVGVAAAVENPLSTPNNKYGIHILFPEEVEQAANLINSSGGDYGYVTIPIQAGDKDLQKWQTFMNKARDLHVIPLIRLATEGDYFNTKLWRKPTAEDVLDFANFLSSLSWPTKNKYIIVFNEVNRGDEWGGSPNAAEYADLLLYASTVFKNKSADFFIISSGLDNAAPNERGVFINEYDYLQQMRQAQPTLFNSIDGLGSHSYPNPGFSQSPTNNGLTGVASFRYERNLVKTLSGRQLPIFITETGWSRDSVPEPKIENYYQEAFSSIWNDSAIVAITPFLLRAGTPPFDKFSFISENGGNQIYNVVEKLPKVKGEPILEDKQQESTPSAKVLGAKDFSKKTYQETMIFELPQSVKILTRWLLKI
ncbi:MAG: hypothetical protein HYV37_03430 [Candidatus Levyibacteriota bacterium]|nr:MAG: hypothetical protein HYV37_03430 [Candidatus Levybacteria bacterium]